MTQHILSKFQFKPSNTTHSSSLAGFIKFSVLILMAALYSAASIANESNDDVNVNELVKKIDRLYRSEYSQSEMVMTIVTPDYQRSLTMDTWSQGLDKTLVKITAPKKEAGVASLKVGEQMWNFFPKINRTIKVPPSMMMSSWMGSDFTNDDLVRSESMEEDYTATAKRVDGLYYLVLKPHENTVTVWDRIEVDIDESTLVPVEQRFYNERNELMRTMRFSNVKTIDGKTLPMDMELIPHNKDGHITRIQYQSIAFPNKIEDSTFSLQSLRR